MKKLSFITVILIFGFISAYSQPCPDSLYITSQAQVNSFQILYPNCTEIEGNVFISGSDITNLNGLNALTSIGGFLRIRYNDALTSLTGLDNVTSIGGYLYIYGNDVLTSLTGLDNVTSIGGYLFIRWNDALTSLTGLDNIESSTIEDLYIQDNSLLSTCEILSICDYLVSPNGTIDIYGNATGCNNPEEVQDSCIANYVSVEEQYLIEGCYISPNPFTSATTLLYTLEKPSVVAIRIFNSKGQPIDKVEQKQLKGEQQVQWNAEGLPAGMYYFRIQAGEKLGGGKMVKIE